MDNRVKKGFKFDTSIPEQARAVIILDLMGRKQAAFMSALIDDFIEKYDIDVNTVTREEIEAVMVLSKKGKVIARKDTTERTNDRIVTKEVTKESIETESRDDNADINEDLLSQMNLFE